MMKKSELIEKLVETVGSKLVENPLKIVLLILEDEKITKNRMSEILNIRYLYSYVTFPAILIS